MELYLIGGAIALATLLIIYAFVENEKIDSE